MKTKHMGRASRVSRERIAFPTPFSMHHAPKAFGDVRYVLCAMRYALCAFFLYALLHSNFVLAQKEADGALGTWFNEEKDCKLRIYKCGKSGEKYCGKIVWLDEPNEEDGTPKVDDENSDPKLQKRPLMGLVIMKGFVYDEDNVWEDGKIYDPENGKEYSCKMTLISKDRLDIRGYIGFSFIGRTAEWTRAE